LRKLSTRVDVRDVRAVVAAGVDDAQVAYHRRSRGGDARAAFAHFDHVPENVGALGQRHEKVIAHQRLDTALQDGEGGKSRSQRGCRKNRRAHKCDPVVLPLEQRLLIQLEQSGEGPQTDRQSHQADRRVNRDTGERVPGEE
jgi:hypothetical protein